MSESAEPIYGNLRVVFKSGHVEIIEGFAERNYFEILEGLAEGERSTHAIAGTGISGRKMIGFWARLSDVAGIAFEAFEPRQPLMEWV